MSLFLGKILPLLTTPPGNLIYHLVLVFSIAGALLGAVQSLRSSISSQKRRMVIGLCILLGLQLVLFAISGLTWPGWLNSQVVFPPLDRAVTLLTLVWIIWLWAFPEPMHMADAATLLLSLLGITVLGLTLAFWAQKPASSFNLSWYETGWQIFSITVILFGILGLVLRKPNGWGYGLAMLILGFLGHFTTLVHPMNGNFPGFVRLAQLAMFPILLTLSQRFPLPTQVEAPVVKPGKTDELIQESRHYSTDPKTFHALMSLAAETDSGKIGQALVRGIAQAMLADICFLITRGEDKVLSINCGYDLIREENLAGKSIDQGSLPLLANAIQRGHPLRLPASSTSSDLKGLGKILSMSNPGNLLCVPVTSPEHGPLGGILILSPYSNRVWSAEDQTYLSNVSSLFSPILERGQHAAALEIEHDQSVKEAHNVMERAAEEKKKYEQMVIELEKRPAGPVSTEHAEAIAPISQELRQQTSSIIGYADLLMGESVGILGTLQRKFIERIKASSERIDGLVDDLIQTTNLETGKMEFKPEPVDLNLIIDNAMANTSTQIREKNITLRLDLTGTAPRIQTDRFALQQILIHLLQNATAATQTEGNITLRVKMQDDEDHHFLSIQVTDNGGGIASEDIPHVFARSNRAENSLIQGLGNTGVGLYITKALVEAQNGHIWIETEAGIGSTFNVLLPVVVELPLENQ